MAMKNLFFVAIVAILALSASVGKWRDRSQLPFERLDANPFIAYRTQMHLVIF